MANNNILPSLSDREALLLSVLGEHLQHGLYGADIRRTVKEEYGINIALGSLYVMLGRLVDKGFLERVDGELITDTENLRRQYYRITKNGAEALKAKVEILQGFQPLAWGSAS